MEVDRDRGPASELVYLGMQHEILDLRGAEFFDGIRDAPQQERHTALGFPARIGQAEVFSGPGGWFFHRFSMPT